MKKRVSSLFLALALCLMLLPTAVYAEDVSGEAFDGQPDTSNSEVVDTSADEETDSEQTKTVIKTVEDLQAFAAAVNNGDYDNKTDAIVSLDADLDLTGVAWTPIGDDTHDFAGTFDGQGHTISNITIGTEDAPITGDMAGLFGVIEGTIKNLLLDKVSVSANVDYYVGGLVAYAVGPIENCHVTNLDMDAVATGVGGLIGYATSGNSIYGCSVSGEIAAKSGCMGVGGFIGSMGKNAQITYSGATVAVIAPNERGSNIGGFIGRGNGERAAKSIIKNCYAKGNVTGDAYAGGFTGSMTGMDIQNCYATGDVTGAYAEVSSFAGTNSPANYADGIAQNCYTTGTVTPGTAVYKAAFLNENATARSEVVNCYYVNANTTVATQYEKATAKSLEDMKTEAFAGTLNNNDTTNGWIYKEGQTPLCGAEPADYSKVDAALAKIPADLTVYTEETVAALDTAKDNVVKGKVVAKQSEVDAMATAIEDAIAALEYKPADYTAVDAAIEKANALNESSYTNFDTVKKAIDAVVRDKNITEQDAVDAMAKAIEDAINGLVRKSSGGHTSSNNYAVDVPSQPENGSLAVSPKNASKGSTVTITVTPDSGYQLDTITATDAAGNTLKLTNTGNGKYTFTMPGSKVTVKASFAQTPETSPFTDVAANAYYYEAVKWAVGKNITGGVGNGLFAPDQPCTRAQMVTFLWRASGSPEPSSSAGKFTDVPESAYYAKAVAWAVEKGITLGTSDTTFAPDLVCNRAQSVTFLYRALGTKTAQNADFRDVPANSYYTEAVAWASANDVTTGIGNGLFGPDADCTRAQIVTFLYRTMEK